MSKFEITMKFLLNQDELGTRLGALTSSYRGEVLTIQPVKEEVPQLATLLGEDVRISKVEVKKKSLRARNREKYDIVTIEEVNDILDKYFRVGDSLTRNVWAEKICKKSSFNWNVASVRSHISRLKILGVLTPLHKDKGSNWMFTQIVDSKTIRKMQTQTQRKQRLDREKAERVAKANKEGLRAHYETR